MQDYYNIEGGVIMYAILKVFKSIGDELECKEAYKQLMIVYQGASYPNKKALGSLGGAVNGKTIIRIGNKYQRIR